jgi:hypothetical protein
VTAVLTADLPTSRTGRILGVDAARALALVGMFATHILPLRAGGAETPTGLIADGRASALFAVLAGLGVAFSSGGTRRPACGRAHLAAAAALLTRGALVGLLGLWLAGFDPPAAVILAYYGLLFVVATPLLRLPASALAVGAVLACVLAPMASLVLRFGLPARPGKQPGLGALADPGALLRTLALTGYYPVLSSGATGPPPPIPGGGSRSTPRTPACPSTSPTPRAQHSPCSARCCCWRGGPGRWSWFLLPWEQRRSRSTRCTSSR